MDDDKKERKINNGPGFFAANMTIRENFEMFRRTDAAQDLLNIRNFPARTSNVGMLQGAFIGFFLVFLSRQVLSLMGSLSFFPESTNIADSKETLHKSEIVFIVFCMMVCFILSFTGRDLPRRGENDLPDLSRLYPFQGEILDTVPDQVNLPESLVKTGWPLEDQLLLEPLQPSDQIVLAKISDQIYMPCKQKNFIDYWVRGGMSPDGGFRDFATHTVMRTPHDVIRVTGAALQKRFPPPSLGLGS